MKYILAFQHVYCWRIYRNTKCEVFFETPCTCHLRLANYYNYTFIQIRTGISIIISKKQPRPHHPTPHTNVNLNLDILGKYRGVWLQLRGARKAINCTTWNLGKKINKLGLNWAKLSSSWDQTFVKLQTQSQDQELTLLSLITRTRTRRTRTRRTRTITLTQIFQDGMVLEV